MTDDLTYLLGQNYKILTAIEPSLKTIIDYFLYFFENLKAIAL